MTKMTTTKMTTTKMTTTTTTFAFPFVDNYDVRGSSFFARHDELPTPAAVRTRAAERSRRGALFHRPPVQYFRALGVAVKYGHDVSVSEAHALLFVRAHVPGVPVPEVYGWRRDGRQTFVYMELVHGQQLRGMHSGAVHSQLQGIVAALRRVPQGLVSATPFVGHVNGTHLRDWALVNSATPTGHAGPFAGPGALHDWLAETHAAAPLDAVQAVQYTQQRARLPDGARVCLTHGSLVPENVLVRQAGTSWRIVAVLDWSQAGWYPAYWETLDGFGVDLQPAARGAVVGPALGVALGASYANYASYASYASYATDMTNDIDDGDLSDMSSDPGSESALSEYVPDYGDSEHGGTEPSDSDNGSIVDAGPSEYKAGLVPTRLAGAHAKGKAVEAVDMDPKQREQAREAAQFFMLIGGGPFS